MYLMNRIFDESFSVCRLLRLNVLASEDDERSRRTRSLPRTRVVRRCRKPSCGEGRRERRKQKGRIKRKKKKKKEEIQIKEGEEIFHYYSAWGKQEKKKEQKKKRKIRSFVVLSFFRSLSTTYTPTDPSNFIQKSLLRVRFIKLIPIYRSI